MIELNANFSFERDAHGWQLHQWRDGKDKDGSPKRQKTTTYHATLEQVCSMVIDRTAGGCKSMKDLRELLSTSEAWLTRYVEAKAATRMNSSARPRCAPGYADNSINHE